MLAAGAQAAQAGIGSDGQSPMRCGMEDRGPPRMNSGGTAGCPVLRYEVRELESKREEGCVVVGVGRSKGATWRQTRR